MSYITVNMPPQHVNATIMVTSRSPTVTDAVHVYKNRTNTVENKKLVHDWLTNAHEITNIDARNYNEPP